MIDGRVYKSESCDPTSCSSYVSTPSPPFADFPLLSSSLTPTSMNGRLYGYYETSYGSGQTESIFDVTFSLAHAEAFQLTGALHDMRWGSHGFPPDPSTGLGDLTVLLIRLSDGSRIFDRTMMDIICNGQGPPNCTSVSVVFDLLGVLEAGEYRLYAYAGGFGEYYPGSNSLDFEFTLVPEPTTALLVGIGLLGLALPRRG